MNELYWINVLGTLNYISSLFCFWHSNYNMFCVEYCSCS